MEITHLSLFTGIGGLDLAAEWAGIETVGQCEWAEYPTKVLEKHWPDVPRWRDIRTLTGDSFYDRTGRRTVDIISGGFPCQPFSIAGKRRGKEDNRYLWPEMVRVIKELRPTWVVGENVAGIIRMALPDILSELESCGYRTRTFLIPACAVGARHRRYRVAIVANSDSGGQLYRQNEIKSTKKREQTQREFEQCCQAVANAQSQSEGRLSIGTEQEKPGFIGCCKDVQHADSTRCEKQHVTAEPNKERFIGWRCNSGKNESRERSAESILGGMAHGVPGWLDGDLDFFINHYWDKEPDIPRIDTGIEHRVDRLKCLGNAVVPQQFYPIFKAIANLN